MHIHLKNLTKTYGSHAALKNVNLYFPPGKIIALLGSNGAGKTTLLRCLSGISVPEKGSIEFDEMPFRRDELALRKRLFFMPDFPFVYPDMRVLRHIGMVLRIYDADRVNGIDERVVRLLRDFDMLTLSDGVLSQLSRGEAYKAALAAFLAVDPELWLLDEPFASGMDPHGLTTFKERVRDAAARGRTVIYSTQILDIAEAFSDSVCVIHKGEVRAFGPVAALKTDASSTGPVLEELFKSLRAEGGV